MNKKMTSERRLIKFTKDVREAFGDSAYLRVLNRKLRFSMPGAVLIAYEDVSSEFKVDPDYPGFESMPLDILPKVHRILKRDAKRLDRQQEGR
jgi:hypothetical protein